MASVSMAQSRPASLFHNIKISTRAIAVAVLSFFSLIGVSNAAEEVNIKDGHAVSGYDVVSYFKAGQPTKGTKEFSATYQGNTYLFSSAENRDKFNANPSDYAPQYGGYCAFGTAMGRKFDTDPHAWHIADGKLYLNLNKKVQTRWLADVPGFIKGAENNWKIIENVADSDLEANPPAGLTQGAL